MKTEAVTKRKFFFVSLISVFLLLVMVFSIPPASAQTATLKLNPRVIEDTTLEPSSNFIITVDVDDVIQMFGYEFCIKWNPEILELISYVPNPPFTYQWEYRIEPGKGYFAYSIWPGEPGFTSPYQYPVGTLIFHVVDWGYSELDLQNTILADVYGERIQHLVLDGYFINVPPVYEADLFAWKAKAEYMRGRKWDTKVDPDNELRALVKNKGTVGVNVKVVFTITKGAFSITVHANVRYLQPGGKVTIIGPALDLSQLDGYGKYHVSAQASYWSIIGIQPVIPNGATIKTFWFETVDP